MSKRDFIVEDLLSKIYQQKYPQNAKLPSERQLMMEYDVSRNTIRKALDKLKDIGVIKSISRSGHVVKKLPNNTSMIYSSITEKKSNQIVSKVISLKKRKISREETIIFDNCISENVWELKRLRIVDQKVMELQEVIFPLKLFPYLDETMGSGSMQKLIIDVGLSISHSLATFQAVNLSEEEAEIFHEKKNTAAMRIISRTISKEGTVVEYTKRLVIDYSGTFRLPFHRDLYEYRHQI